MKNGNGLWIVALVAVGWLCFLIGFSLASLTGTPAAGAAQPAAAKPVAGGYGK